MVDFKKFSDIDIYKLVGVNFEATDAEVCAEIINQQDSNVSKFFRSGNRTARKPSNAIRTRIPTTQKPPSSSISSRKL